MTELPFLLEPIGYIRSPLVSLDDAPRQGDEGAVEAWIDLLPAAAPGLSGITAGMTLIVITWLHLARRDILRVHPRGDTARTLTGVFATRSPHRPNPLGLHEVSVLEVDGQRIKVVPLEAVDGTPVVDMKPLLGPIALR